VTTPSDSLSLGVAVPAAGSGLRMGGARKAFLSLGGRPLLEHALRPFLDHPSVTVVVVALPPQDVGTPAAWIRDLGPRVRVVAGGETRVHSVLSALEAIGDSVEWVAVHDAARPLVTPAIIDRCIDALEPGGGVVAGWPLVDTLKEVDSDGTVLDTPDRDRFWAAQTPQIFPRDAILEAYRAAVTEGIHATDDAEVYSRFGGTVRVVEGSPWNLKITHPSDLEVAERIHAHLHEIEIAG
jgi:2-C-methyl-D-erythritol 4-phosphate cytidylyltransferase